MKLTRFAKLIVIVTPCLLLQVWQLQILQDTL